MYQTLVLRWDGSFCWKVNPGRCLDDSRNNFFMKIQVLVSRKSIVTMTCPGVEHAASQGLIIYSGSEASRSGARQWWVSSRPSAVRERAARPRILGRRPRQEEGEGRHPHRGGWAGGPVLGGERSPSPPLHLFVCLALFSLTLQRSLSLSLPCCLPESASPSIYPCMLRSSSTSEFERPSDSIRQDFSRGTSSPRGGRASRRLFVATRLGSRKQPRPRV